MRENSILRNRTVIEPSRSSSIDDLAHKNIFASSQGNLDAFLIRSNGSIDARFVDFHSVDIDHNPVVAAQRKFEFAGCWRKDLARKKFAACTLRKSNLFCFNNSWSVAPTIFTPFFIGIKARRRFRASNDLVWVLGHFSGPRSCDVPRTCGIGKFSHKRSADLRQ